MADEKAAVIEIQDAPPVETKEKVDLTALTEAGFKASEIEAAKKHGLVEKPGEEKEEKKAAEEKAQGKKADESKEDAEKKKEDAAKPPIENVSELLVQLDKIDDEKKVHEILDKMGIKNTKDHNFFLEARRDRKKRQAAQSERDHAIVQLRFQQQKAADLEKRIAELEKGGKKEAKADDFTFVDPETGEVKEKPLTKSDLEKMEEDKNAKEKEEQEKRNGRVLVARQAVDRQENEAKERYEGFDEVIENFTTEILQNVNNLEKIFPDDPKTQRKVRTLVRQAHMAAAQADHIPEGELNVADISYEIGTLHPKYKPGATGQDADKGENGGENGGEANSEKVKKALEDSQKSRSSAGLNGGSAKRAVSVQDLTLKDLNALPYADFARLRKEHPKVVERILREKSAA